MELKSITFPGMDEPYLAAPGGYGYGEGLVNIGNANDDVAFTAALSEQFAKTSSKTRQIAFTYGGSTYIGTLWNAGNNYGTLIANSYVEPNVAYRFKQLVRICNNGTWGAWVDNSPTAFAPTSHNHFVGVITNYGSDANNCTANGWYLVNTAAPKNLPVNQYGTLHTYNETYATQIFYAIDGSVWQRSHTSLDGMKQKAWTSVSTGMKLLWTNASPNSAFGEQTLNLDLSGYDFVYIEFLTHCSSGAWRWYRITQTVPVNHESDWKFYKAVGFSETGSAMAFRAYSLANNQIRFGKSYYAASYNTSTLSESNNLYVPVAIYGIKGVG